MSRSEKRKGKGGNVMVLRFGKVNFVFFYSFLWKFDSRMVIWECKSSSSHYSALFVEKAVLLQQQKQRTGMERDYDTHTS